MKQIVYTIENNGEDGRGPTIVNFASFIESCMDIKWNEIKPSVRGYYSKGERIVDIEKAKKLEADGYIVKASAIPSEVLAEAVRTIESSPTH